MGKYLLIIVLTCVIIIDFRTKTIPDIVHPVLIAGALIFRPTGLKEALIGAVLGFVLMYTVSLLGPVGGGDIKLMGSLGTWFGLRVADVFLASFIIGLFFALFYYLKTRDRRHEVPFGPSIAAAAAILYFSGLSLLNI
ncbi:Type 4 prepilin-like proteins leader peptide-processing enzyme [Koleobacter methoxysyntrophicus]|uniref:Type 4 prepilin-like proteins leader peptide-processing enzyme n=1 Tax=Koleobacter methoxysyntrophicus TaxID=2751313 RepID=A0A8A0RSP8_9FIRM|nr:A24 family peptidase [Koleobacter methoxysyntrophicus]QSQ10560.1 Type 4 prepilin-like proteins leader peptide-processing enzyme [Koleobacter methoxysyntrophicus]